MLKSKLTSKNQATIPSEIRDCLNLSAGDTVGFEIDNSKVVLKKISPIDLEYARALESTLEEWNSKNDNEAYSDI